MKLSTVTHPHPQLPKVRKNVGVVIVRVMITMKPTALKGTLKIIMMTNKT